MKERERGGEGEGGRDRGGEKSKYARKDVEGERGRDLGERERRREMEEKSQFSFPNTPSIFLPPSLLPLFLSPLWARYQ